MTENDPGYRDDCEGVVADYDYELGLLGLDRPDTVREIKPPEAKVERSPSRRYAATDGLMLVLVLLLGISCLAGSFMWIGSSSREAEESAVASDNQSVWVDSLPPTIPPPPIPSPPPVSPIPIISPVPTPEPTPSPSPAPRSQSDFCSTPNSHQSYQATALPRPWPDEPPGGAWVAGPAGLPPTVIAAEKVCWWWVWFMDYTSGKESWYLCQTPPS